MIQPLANKQAKDEEAVSTCNADIRSCPANCRNATPSD